MIVCIAEKPSVARDIANILGATERKNGYMEGNGYQVTWTFGHLCMLKEPHEYCGQWKTWSMGSLPIIPSRFGIKLIADEGIERQFHIIENLFQHADEIINCGDAGQEGELIQRWVMQKSGAKCQVKRLWISSLTEESIREGFKSLKNESEYQSLYEAGLSRAIGDWLLGMNATRLYTLKYGGGKGSVLSIGRVQTPTLALIVNRQKEIESFKPEQYWELKTLYRDTIFTAVKSKFTDENEGLALLEKIRLVPFTIVDITTKVGTEMPPRLFDLTSLQVECNKHFGYSADETLKAIQSLYEKKLTTYPRVDTTFLSDDIYSKCPAVLNGLRDYSTLIAPLKGAKLLKRKKVFDTSKVTDHHAIIPTGQFSQNLPEIEQRIFDMVARRFIAVFYPDCKYSSTSVQGEAEKIPFKVTGKQIIIPGWRIVIGNNVVDKDSQESEPVLALFEKGENGPHVPQLSEKWTQPPKPYTEATLLRAMETAGKLVENEELRDALKENGIGRPSTRAAIIETLLKRHYIRKERKNLIATPTGVELINLIHEDLLKSAELTGLWEKKLRGIEKNTYDTRTFLDELKQMVREIVNAVLSDNSSRRITLEATAPAKEIKKIAARKKAKSVRKPSSDKLVADDSILGKACPICGKGIIIKGKTAYGCSEWKKGCTFRLNFK